MHVSEESERKKEPEEENKVSEEEQKEVKPEPKVMSSFKVTKTKNTVLKKPFIDIKS